MKINLFLLVKIKWTCIFQWPHKWGFKLYLLCDVDTSYIYNILFDPGKNSKEYFDFEDYSKPLAENIVLKLLEVINDNKQRIVYFNG